MIPIEHDDPINAKILAISEDKIEGFVREPFEEIARRSGVPVETVMARIAAMLRAGTIRRVRQTLLATNLADGALVAWKVAPEKIDAAFDYMSQRDPFSGHVVLRSTDTVTAGSDYKLWTTLKVPRGFSLQHHGELLAEKVGAEHFRLMPAKGIFTLGVGHVRRKTIEPGSKADEPATMAPVQVVESERAGMEGLDSRSNANSRRKKFEPSPWAGAGRGSRSCRSMNFAGSPRSLNARKIIGRFSTFLEHVKPSAAGVRVTRFNALFHWAVPAGREMEAGGEVGPASHSDALLLARSRTGIQERQHHGGGARHGQRTALGAQSARSIEHLASVRHSGFLHECLLGRAERDQALRDFAGNVSSMVARDGSA